jgi:ABC-2 type transport system permease protein
MDRILTLALKDLKLLVRDKAALFWVFGLPLLIGVLFGTIFGGSNDTSPIAVAVIDQDHSTESSALVASLKKSAALKVNESQETLATAGAAVVKGSLVAYVLIPEGYGDEVRNFRYGNGPALHVGIDPSRKAEGGLLQGVVAQAAYGQMGEMMTDASSSRKNLSTRLSTISSSELPPSEKTALTRFLKEMDRFLTVNAKSNGGRGAPEMGVKIATDPLGQTGNTPLSGFEVTFPQALLWGLLGVVSSFAIGFVRERKQGTLTRLQTSPMSLGEILAGKALGCFIACVAVEFVLLLVGHFAFHIRLESPFLLAFAIGSAAICIVGIVMFLSVLGDSEQAVSGSVWGIMITMAMFGGGMIPLFVMPGWMLTASNFSPLKWTVVAIEGAIWRGYSFTEMLVPCSILLAVGVIAFAAGVRRLSKLI